MTPQLPTLLLVDDNEAHLQSLVSGFARQPYETIAAHGGPAAAEILKARPIDVVVSDLKMPELDGVALLNMTKTLAVPPQVILVTAFGSIESAVEALQMGAYTYLTKPLNINELRLQVAKAMELQLLQQENKQLRMAIDKRFGFEELVGETSEMHALVNRVRAIADTKATVLIEGESGTGKELVARALHKNSSRAKRPFVAIHCAALSESLIESELFGHERGAFTGAQQRRQGMFELADGGTVFLDEVGEIPLATQVKLLRVLENREFMRVGGTETIKVDVRVVAATNRTLLDEVEEGRFREDLYYRLNVVQVTMPPLRARSADIPLLVERFLNEFREEHRKPALRFSKLALQRLMQYPWPGNVRQLRNVIENLVLFSTSEEIDVDDFPQEFASTPTETLQVSVGEPLDLIERRVIEQTLLSTGGNRTRAAEMLGISRRTLLRKIKELGLEG